MDRFQGSGSGLFAVVLVSLVGSLYNAYAAQHNVGGEAGWTIPAIKKVNYSSWAEINSFHVGDTLLFKYNASFHNVDQVNSANYLNCNDTNLKAHYADGNTLIQLNTTGTYYFICGVPGHCAAGQKLKIRVHPAHTPSPSAFSPASEPAEAPSPWPSSAAAPNEFGAPASEPSSILPVPGAALPTVTYPSGMDWIAIALCLIYLL
eukprot:c19077_g1_i1 orf=148-762(+)